MPVSLAVALQWLFDFVLLQVTPPGIANIGQCTYISWLHALTRAQAGECTSFLVYSTLRSCLSSISSVQRYALCFSKDELVLIARDADCWDTIGIDRPPLSAWYEPCEGIQTIAQAVEGRVD
jgi:hypothetical protein